jgi:S1-C subfamily serine protease
VNVLDIVILAAIVAAGVGGWRLGLVKRAFAWAGVAVGLAIAVHYVPKVVTTFGGTSADDRVSVALLFLLLAATVGQTIGLAAGAIAHRAMPAREGLKPWDRAAGAFVGALGVIVLVWMVIPSLATAKGWPARMARDSWVVAGVDALGPDQPAQFAAWGRSISDAPYPSALSPLDNPPNPGRPPTRALSRLVDARVRPSILRIEGRACGQIQEGSGFVAAPGLAVTNAHVVAGAHEVTLEDDEGGEHDGTVVAFDGQRDLAVLSVPSLNARPLPLADGAVGDTGAVYGHPGGGPLEPSPARIGQEITAVGTDISRTRSSRRDVYVLAASLAPGDSGGALIGRDGRVLGTAFAIDPGRANTAYALTNDELRPVLEIARARVPVHTGGCLVH